MEGGPVIVKFNVGKITIDKARVAKTGIVADNSVIHVINTLAMSNMQFKQRQHPCCCYV